MNTTRVSSILTLLQILKGAVSALGRHQDLDDAFDQLRIAGSREEAQNLERQITGIWENSPDPEALQAFKNAATALRIGNFDDALVQLQKALDLDPLFIEAWNRRATLWFLIGEHGKALTDLARVVVLEPRHYGALAAIGHILAREREIDGAEQAFRTALAVNPHFNRAQDALERLER